MGTRIDREETEKLAREVAKLKGESLADAVHHALEHELARMDSPQTLSDQAKVELQDLFAKLDALGPGNGESLSEIEEEMYGEFGEPI